MLENIRFRSILQKFSYTPRPRLALNRLITTFALFWFLLLYLLLVILSIISSTISRLLIIVVYNDWSVLKLSIQTILL